jgi:regulator of replication initiation timing
MEKNDLAMIKAENDRLVADIEKLKQRLREEITRTQAGVRLDLNLEKGRMREESSGQELKIKEVDTRIEQEIAGLKTAIQSSKVNLSMIFQRHFLITNTCPGNHIAIPGRIRCSTCPLSRWSVTDDFSCMLQSQVVQPS